MNTLAGGKREFRVVARGRGLDIRFLPPDPE